MNNQRIKLRILKQAFKAAKIPLWISESESIKKMFLLADECVFHRIDSLRIVINFVIKVNNGCRWEFENFLNKETQDYRDIYMSWVNEINIKRIKEEIQKRILQNAFEGGKGK